jgi:hypothetical protein
MLHCGRADPKLFSDLTEGEAAVDKRLQLGRGEAPSRRVLGSTVRHQAMLLHPVADGRGVAVDQGPDLEKRHTLVQIALEQIAIHAGIFLSKSDGKAEQVFV